MRFYVHIDKILFEDIEWLYAGNNFNTVTEISLRAGVNDGHITMLSNRGLPPLVNKIELDSNTLTANGVRTLLSIIPTDRYFEIVLSDCQSLFSDSIKLCADAMDKNPNLVIKLSGKNISEDSPYLKKISELNQSREPNKPETPEAQQRQVSLRNLVQGPPCR